MVQHGLGPRPITRQKRLHPALRRARLPRHPRGPARRIGRKVAPAADGQVPRADPAVMAQPRQQGIGHLLGKAPEGRPLAAHKRDHRPGPRV